MTTTDSDQASARARDVVLAALAIALVTGITEAAIAGLNLFVLHRIVWVSRDVAWMTPLATVLFFLPVACAVAAASWMLRRRAPLAVVAGGFAFLGAFSLLLPYEQIARWASAVLALGVALQVARLVARDPARSRRRLQVMTVALTIVVAAAGVSIRGWRAWTERRTLAQLPEAGRDAPNVLLVILDTVRKANLHLYGYQRETTPELDRRVGESLVFDHTFAAAPWTLPSHASLFTGRRAADLTADWRRPLSRGPRTLAEALAAKGYVTSGFVANLLYTSYETGLSRGFAHFDDYPFSLSLVLRHAAIGRTHLMQKMLAARTPRALALAVWRFDLSPGLLPANEERIADDVTDAFLAWQEHGTGGRPFFAFLNYLDAHRPYHAPEPYTSRFLGTPPRPIDRYDGAIAWLDHEVGRLLDSLQRRGVLDRTIVVVTSDHGDQFGEHHLNGHANSLYLPLLEVPLIIRYPSAVPAGTRVTAPVTLRDVAATVLDLAGAGGGDGLAGLSLSRYWRSPASAVPSEIIADVSKGINVDTAFPNFHGAMTAILDERLHYIRDGLGREELYAWRADSLELHNLAGDSAWLGERRRLRSRLDAARGDVLTRR